MKKSTMALALLLPAFLLACAGSSEAKHRGFLETNNQADSSEAAVSADNAAQNYDKETKRHNKDKKSDNKKHHDKKMKNKGHWLENERQDIDEDYQEALYKIKKSQMPDNLKDILRSQAEENRSLALEQAEARAELIQKHKAARQEYRDEFMKDKSNRKAVKKVMGILL